MDFAYPHYTATANQYPLLLCGLLAGAIALLYALSVAWREQKLYPIFLLMGSVIAVIYEPLGDIFTVVTYPSVSPIPAFQSFGRTIPVYLVPIYMVFFCAAVLVLIRHVIDVGSPARRWWTFYMSIALGAIAFEQPGIAADAWRYYGSHHALSLNTYPVWVAFANAATVFFVASGVALFRMLVPDARSFLLILLVPFLMAGGHLGVSIFAASALYSTTNEVVVYSAALITIGTCLLSVWFARRVVVYMSSSRGDELQCSQP